MDSTSIEQRAGSKLGPAELAGGRARRGQPRARPDRGDHRAGRQGGAARWPPPPAPIPKRVRRAADDSIRAMMLIRTYRVRGHLAAKLDPLGLASQRVPGRPDAGLSRLHRRRPRPPDLALAARLASSRPSSARSCPCLQANYCGHRRPRIYAHQRPRGAPLPPGADGGQGRRRSASPPRASRRSSTRSSTASSGRNSSPANMSAPNGSGSTAAKARSRRLNRSSNMAARSASARSPSAWPTAGG